MTIIERALKPAANDSRIGPIVRFALAFELLRWLIFAPLGAGMLRHQVHVQPCQGPA